MLLNSALITSAPNDNLFAAMTIDAHQHFWQFRPERDTWITDDMAALRRDFLPDDLEPILWKHKVEGCVAVQADPSEKETGFLAQLARDYPFIKGVVGWTDLRSPQLQARLEYYHEFHEIKGFRLLLQDEPDDYFNDPAFLEGLSHLESYQFTFDLLVRHQQLPLVASLVKRFPKQQFVLDHLGKPPVKARQLQPWRKDLEQLARYDNVYCKLSGLSTEANWYKWSAADVLPYLKIGLDAFGSHRTIYGSDWPVCNLAGTYSSSWEILQQFLMPLTPGEKKAILGDNAVRFYHL
jgi:L-fuconolactonase